MDTRVPLPKILIYQNENCDTLINYLAFSGFDIINTSEKDVLEKLHESNYDLCILGYFKVNIPDLRLLNYLRKFNKKVPAIIISNKSDYSYVIDAFNAGADDYIAKPYNIEELVCRIKALLKRCGVKIRQTGDTYKIGNYVFNTKTCILALDAAETKLTAKENKVLALLCAYKNELLTKEILLHSIWKDNNRLNKRCLDVYICRLRNCLSKDKRIKINTITGLGYSLVIEGEENIE